MKKKKQKLTNEQWRQRAEKCLDRIARKINKGVELEDLGEMVLAANALLSNLSEGYDSLYEEMENAGQLNRQASHPISGDKDK